MTNPHEGAPKPRPVAGRVVASLLVGVGFGFGSAYALAKYFELQQLPLSKLILEQQEQLRKTVDRLPESQVTNLNEGSKQLLLPSEVRVPILRSMPLGNLGYVRGLGSREPTNVEVPHATILPGPGDCVSTQIANDRIAVALVTEDQDARVTATFEKGELRVCAYHDTKRVTGFLAVQAA